MYKFTDLYPNYNETSSTREETVINASEQAAVDLDTAPIPVNSTTGNTMGMWLGVGALFVVLMSLSKQGE